MENLNITEMTNINGGSKEAAQVALFAGGAVLIGMAAPVVACIGAGAAVGAISSGVGLWLTGSTL